MRDGIGESAWGLVSYVNRFHRVQVLDQFEGLQLGPAAPGQADPSSDPSYLPRPAGPEAEPAARPPPPFHKGNCDPRFIRLTTNAVPAQQVHTREIDCQRPLASSCQSLGVLMCTRTPT